MMATHGCLVSFFYAQVSHLTSAGGWLFFIFLPSTKDLQKVKIISF